MPRELSAGEAVTWAERHLFERRSVVHEYELWRHALEAARGAAVSIEDVKSETASREYLRSGDDKVAQREVLAREWEIVQTARDGIGTQAPLAPRAFNEDRQLTAEQSRALNSILWSTSFIALFRGGAGTGKSFVLRKVQQALDESGRASVVLAPQRQQVLDLARDGLSATQTVAECLQRQQLPERGIVIVQRGYAVTSYGSQGKTVDHVLFSDSAVRAASSAQQWYVTISRGRKSVRIFTPDKEQLRHAIMRSGERELALDLVPQKKRSWRQQYKLVRSIRRGREFARRVCLMTMHSWSSQFLRTDLNQQHENRTSPINRANKPPVLAA